MRSVLLCFRSAVRSGVIAVAVSGTCFLGCLAQATGPARAQEAAQELNLHARFGRMEVAMERVSATEHDEFARTHQNWGGRIRIADSEISGLKVKSSKEALVMVRVAWYAQDQQELRNTTLSQTWRDHHGNWYLEKEERIDGDLGLMGEIVVPVGPDTAPKHAQFPTVRLGENDSSN